jgi:flagellar hook assembly protein FlgD
VYRTWIGRTVLTATSAPDFPASSAAWISEARPNPFRSTTSLDCSLARPGRARVTVHDISGRTVRRIFDGEWASGSRSIEWNGRDDDARPAANGVYFIRVEQGASTTTRKVTLKR